MTRLLIARHGNTFEAGETPRRIGARTDLPLVEKGEAQARALGRYLKEHGLIPDTVFTSELKRTIQTARIAMMEAGKVTATRPLDMFNEIDYGPDENKTEAEIRLRLGDEALENWDSQGIPPPGWHSEPRQIIDNWHAFADTILKENPGENVLVITSNGIARFAPCITGDFEAFAAMHNIKIAPGALCILDHDKEEGWQVEDWNIRPHK